MPFLTAHYPKKISFHHQGKNVFLRPPEYKDWQEWSQLRKENMSYLKPWEPSWNIHELERSYFVKRIRFFEKLSINDEAYSFLIFEKPYLQLIGEININNVQRGVVQSCSIGYWISENKMGLGLMSEAISLIKKFSFDELELHRIEAACLQKNQRSLNTLKKNYFNIEGIAKKYLKINGKWQDHVLLSCINEEHS
tara:strand:- start:269 stop:853 length:585 start_codon:yes stop_codon:yes gene_type:complete